MTEDAERKITLPKVPTIQNKSPMRTLQNYIPANINYLTQTLRYFLENISDPAKTKKMIEGNDKRTPYYSLRDKKIFNNIIKRGLFDGISVVCLDKL